MEKKRNDIAKQRVKTAEKELAVLLAKKAAGDDVDEGDILAAGDTIGNVGSTGRVSRPQLHFEIRKSRQPIDPRNLIS